MECSNLFAACRKGGQLVVKRVPLDEPTRQRIAHEFLEQERLFRKGVTEEVPFDGGWKADSNELLTVTLPEEASALVKAVESNPISIPLIGKGRLQDERIRALFTARPTPNHRGKPVILIQLFRRTQILSHSGVLTLRDEVFSKMEHEAVALGQKLECIVEDNRLKFKSFHNVRMIMGSMGKQFRAATDQEMRTFASHVKIGISSVDDFVIRADETVRKMVQSISVARVLDEFGTSEIMAASKNVKMDLREANGRVVVPDGMKEMKRFLQFLDDRLYRAPLTRQSYITNSKRRA